MLSSRNSGIILSDSGSCSDAWGQNDKMWRIYEIVHVSGFFFFYQRHHYFFKEQHQYLKNRRQMNHNTIQSWASAKIPGLANENIVGVQWLQEHWYLDWSAKTKIEKVCSPWNTSWHPLTAENNNNNATRGSMQHHFTLRVVSSDPLRSIVTLLPMSTMFECWSKSTTLQTRGWTCYKLHIACFPVSPCSTSRFAAICWLLTLCQKMMMMIMTMMRDTLTHDGRKRRFSRMCVT